MDYGKTYFTRVTELLGQVWDTQQEHIRQAAELLVDTVTSGRRVYFFGCTHAGILSQEAFYRTGGLAVVNPILPPGLTCDVTPITLTSALERLDGFGTKLADAVGFQVGDLLFIHSVSGRNAVPVDMALRAREQGVTVVALTSLAYSKASSPRAACGLRLFEAADLVIDNGGCYGDAAVEIEGFSQKVAPTSTVVGAAIVNAIAAEATARFVEQGIDPPVFKSANIDGGDAYNQVLLETYCDQIRYM